MQFTYVRARDDIDAPNKAGVTVSVHQSTGSMIDGHGGRRACCVNYHRRAAHLHRVGYSATEKSGQSTCNYLIKRRSKQAKRRTSAIINIDFMFEIVDVIMSGGADEATKSIWTKHRRRIRYVSSIFQCLIGGM